MASLHMLCVLDKGAIENTVKVGILYQLTSPPLIVFWENIKRFTFGNLPEVGPISPLSILGSRNITKLKDIASPFTKS